MDDAIGKLTRGFDSMGQLVARGLLPHEAARRVGTVYQRVRILVDIEKLMTGADMALIEQTVHLSGFPGERIASVVAMAGP